MEIVKNGASYSLVAPSHRFFTDLSNQLVYALSSANVKIRIFCKCHLKLNEFYLSNRSLLFFFGRNISKNDRIFFGFNYFLKLHRCYMHPFEIKHQTIITMKRTSNSKGICIVYSLNLVFKI